MINSKCKKQST